MTRPKDSSNTDKAYLEGLFQAQAKRDIVWWSERRFYIPETSEKIQLLTHQAAILKYIFTRINGQFRYPTIIYSTPKKSGKTTVAGLVARWAAETWGPFQEILCVGNDAEQAKERAFAAVARSIELTPGYHHGRRELRGQWHCLDNKLTYRNGSIIKAIATDYQGEAGANPSLTVWTELWGFISKAAVRFWAEMAPSPTRTDSLCWIETYAGFEGESELLWGLYESTVKKGRQLTAGELGSLQAFEEAPNHDSLIPCWVNDEAGIFAYWDEGEIGRRMPWQHGEHGKKYYASQAIKQTPAQFDRLHNNRWSSAESEFVPIEWWDACYNPLPLVPGDKTTLVMSLDAAVSGDCFGLTVVSRDPNDKDNSVVERLSRKWDPPPGGTIDYAGPEAAVREICSQFNVSEVAYDPYQLHDLATRLNKEGVAWFRQFPQGVDRLKADKLLFDIIRDRRIRHSGNPNVREHIQNANAKQSKDEDTKMRIVKKSENRHIDLAVCLSMASAECLRLNL